MAAEQPLALDQGQAAALLLALGRRGRRRRKQIVAAHRLQEIEGAQSRRLAAERIADVAPGQLAQHGAEIGLDIGAGQFLGEMADAGDERPVTRRRLGLGEAGAEQQEILGGDIAEEILDQRAVEPAPAQPGEIVLGDQMMLAGDRQRADVAFVELFQEMGVPRRRRGAAQLAAIDEDHRVFEDMAVGAAADPERAVEQEVALQPRLVGHLGERLVDGVGQHEHHQPAIVIGLLDHAQPGRGAVDALDDRPDARDVGQDVAVGGVGNLGARPGVEEIERGQQGGRDFGVHRLVAPEHAHGVLAHGQSQLDGGAGLGEEIGDVGDVLQLLQEELPHLGGVPEDRVLHQLVGFLGPLRHRRRPHHFRHDSIR